MNSDEKLDLSGNNPDNSSSSNLDFLSMSNRSMRCLPIIDITSNSTASNDKMNYFKEIVSNSGSKVIYSDSDSLFVTMDNL